MKEGAIFLSAGIPDPMKAPEYAATAEPIAIAAAVSALLNVTLGRRLLVWGGHPAITPIVWTVAEELDVDYGSWVRLFQSMHFRDAFPEDNERFQNVSFTEDLGGREESLALMRKEMFSAFAFGAAVFIGGMKGILDEHALFHEAHPSASILPLASTGGAALDLYSRMGAEDVEAARELDYVSLLHRRLGVDPRERRYERPDQQPDNLLDRFWIAG